MTDMTQSPALQPAQASQEVTDPNVRVVELDEPIQRTSGPITQLRIRKPNSGALRGASLIGLAQISVTDLQVVLPRICTPQLTTQEIAMLDPADLMTVGAAVAAFFMTKADKAAYQIA